MEQELEDLLKAHDRIVFAYLFGSCARRQETPLSDIDIAVYLVEDADPLEEKLSLMGDLCTRLRRDDIDIVVMNSAPLSLLGRILAHRVVLLDRSPHRRHLFESLTLRKYHDFCIKEKALLERRFGLAR